MQKYQTRPDVSTRRRQTGTYEIIPSIQIAGEEAQIHIARAQDEAKDAG